MPLIATEDLIDAQEVASMLGLSQRNSVSLYLKKYVDMPRPVIDLGPNRPHLWLRPEIEKWLADRGPVRRGRPPRRPTASSEGNRPPSGGTGGSEGDPEPRAPRRRSRNSRQDA
jgi:glutathione-regulated potassium-efflux system ancillary protein KefG